MQKWLQDHLAGSAASYQAVPPAFAQMRSACAAQMLEGATSIVGQLIASCPADANSLVCSAVYASLYRNQDYTRKVQLIRWYQGVAARQQTR